MTMAESPPVVANQPPPEPLTLDESSRDRPEEEITCEINDTSESRIEQDSEATVLLPLKLKDEITQDEGSVTASPGTEFVRVSDSPVNEVVAGATDSPSPPTSAVGLIPKKLKPESTQVAEATDSAPAEAADPAGGTTAKKKGPREKTGATRRGNAKRRGAPVQPPRGRSPLPPPFRRRNRSPMPLRGSASMAQIIILGVAQRRYADFVRRELEHAGFPCETRYLDRQPLSAALRAAVDQHIDYVFIVGKDNERDNTVSFKLIGSRDYRQSRVLPLSEALSIMFEREHEMGRMLPRPRGRSPRGPPTRDIYDRPGPSPRDMYDRPGPQEGWGHDDPRGAPIPRSRPMTPPRGRPPMQHPPQQAYAPYDDGYGRRPPTRDGYDDGYHRAPPPQPRRDSLPPRPLDPYAVDPYAPRDPAGYAHQQPQQVLQPDDVNALSSLLSYFDNSAAGAGYPAHAGYDPSLPEFPQQVPPAHGYGGYDYSQLQQLPHGYAQSQPRVPPNSAPYADPRGRGPPAATAYSGAPRGQSRGYGPY